MDVVDAALEGLQPVALLPDLGHRALLGCNLRPLEERRVGLLVGRAHVGEHQARDLVGRVGLNAHLVSEIRLGWLGRHVNALPVDVELPAVIDAAEAALFVAAEPEVGAAVRATRVDDADPAIRVAEREQVLAEQPEIDRRAVGLSDLPGEEGGHPVATHHLAERRARPDACQQLILFFG